MAACASLAGTRFLVRISASVSPALTLTRFETSDASGAGGGGNSKRSTRELKSGELRIDRQKVKAEERLDGKYLVITSDDSLSTEDVALSYKQLAEVEAAWRSLKTDLDLRPMNHRQADRIHAHVLLCWLALLLVRVTEVSCGEQWRWVRQEMNRLHRGVFESPAGRFVQLTQPTNLQKRYLKALQVPEPPRFEKIEATQRQIELAPS